MIDDALRLVFEATATTYGRMLDHFRPCKPGNEFLEQNLVTLFAHEFLKVHPKDGLAFSELPFRSKTSQNWGSRLDAYLVGGGCEYLLEAKANHTKADLLKLIEADLKRIHDPRLSESLDIMANGRPGVDDQRTFTRPSRKVGVIIADCWSKSVASLWNGDTVLMAPSGKPYKHLNAISRITIPVRDWGGFRYSILGGWTLLSGEQE